MQELSVLLSRQQHAAHGARIEALVAQSGRVVVPVFSDASDENQAGEVHRAVTAPFDLAWFTRDTFSTSRLGEWSESSRRFFHACDTNPRLKWLHLFSSGSDFPILDPLIARGVCVTSSAGASAIPLAQTAFAGLLAMSRGFLRFIALQRRKAWVSPVAADFPADLQGQTVVIVGMGGVGRELARLCKAVGLQVVAVTRTGQLPTTHALPDCDEVWPFTALEQLAPRAQWLALACSLTPQTRGLVSARVIRALPRPSHVINVARGAVIDEAALCEALGTGQVTGAYLDVFAEEPLPQTSPLWDLPNVMLSPHNAAISSGNEGRATDGFLSNLEAWLAGLPMRNVASR